MLIVVIVLVLIAVWIYSDAKARGDKLSSRSATSEP